MPEYNLGRAHGTIRIDYEKSGAQNAKEDIQDIGEEADRTGRKIEDNNRSSERSYRQLGQSTRNTKITPDLDSSVIQQFIANLRQIQQNTRTSSSILNTFSGRLKLIVGGVAVLTPGIAGLAVSLASLAGLAGVAAGALAGLGAVAGTVGTGISGIGDAFKAAATQAKGAGGAAASSAKAQRAAARAIEDAKRSLADAEENLRRTQEDAARAVAQALRAVIEAQRDVAEAQRDAIRAQESLNRARQQAVRDLEDMQFALRGGSLDERQAILDVKEAQEALNKVLKDPTATADDIERATINLEKQKLALDEARLANQRLATDSAAASAAGVEGSDAVVSAQEGVRSATQSVADAQIALADAQQNVRQVQVDAARQVADAVQGVIDAQRNLTQAYEDAADAGAASGGAANAFADAMAKLSPNARAFVSEVLAMKGAWEEVRNSVQDKLFEGLAAEVRPLANQWLPLLQEGMGKVATGLNGIVKETIAYLKTSEAQANVQNIFNNTGTALSNLRFIVRDLLAAFLDIASVGSDFLPDIATGAANAAARFREFISAAKDSGQLRQWMQEAMDTASQLWQLLKNLGSIIGSVFSALDQEGGGALNTLTALTGQIAEFLKSAEGQDALHALGRILASIGGAVGKVFLSFLDVVADLLVKLEPLIVAFADAAGTYLAVALQALGVVLKPIAELLGFMGPSLGPVIAGIYAMNKAVDAAKILWQGLNVIMKANPFLVIAAAIITLALLIIQNWDSISAFLQEKWEWIKSTAEAIWSVITTFFEDRLNAIRDFFVNIWTVISNFLEQRWTAIKNAVTSTWNGIRDTFINTGNSIVTGVREFVTKVVNFFKELPGKIMDFVKSLPDKFLNLGKDIISGILRGLGDLGSALIRKFKEAISNAWDSVLSFFGIRSPSKLAAEAGQNIVAGLVRGIDTSASAAVRAAASMAAAVGNELTGASGTLATQVNLAANGAGLPQALTESGTLNMTTGNRAVAAGSGSSSSNRTVVIEKVDVYVQGNLDPTNPVAFRRTLVRLKDELRNLDKEYV